MATTVSDTAEVELAIGGLTCASCAARIDEKLNRMDGVTATVNYATEKASSSATPCDCEASRPRAEHTAPRRHPGVYPA